LLKKKIQLQKKQSSSYDVALAVVR
jgi:hypothetical protein